MNHRFFGHVVILSLGLLSSAHFSLAEPPPSPPAAAAGPQRADARSPKDVLALKNAARGTKVSIENLSLEGLQDSVALDLTEFEVPLLRPMISR